MRKDEKEQYCDICGRDMAEVTISGAPDNPLQTFLSFPHIMGCEPVKSFVRFY
jgi:hypothetical protein